MRGVPAAALFLMVTCLMTNLGILALGPLHPAFYPAMDTAGLTFFAMQWRANQQWWALAIAILFAVEDGRHVVFYLQPDQSRPPLASYDLFLNVCYVLQLTCVCVPSFIKILSRREAHDEYS